MFLRRIVLTFVSKFEIDRVGFAPVQDSREIGKEQIPRESRLRVGTLFSEASLFYDKNFKK
jgi:hypothetical protein